MGIEKHIRNREKWAGVGVALSKDDLSYLDELVKKHNGSRSSILRALLRSHQDEAKRMSGQAAGRQT